ncbi:MAG: Tat pathway signal protein [Acetobacteraceae bacterium]|nr:Tat pathway signal protein [Acetobacteraceae bacterium]
MRARLLLVLGLLLGVAAWTAPAAAQNRFNLVNNTGETIQEVYVSPTRVSSWGRDILGQGVLPPGQAVWVVPQLSDCVLDVRVVFAGGRAEERRGVNACQLSRIVWGGAGGGVAGNPSFRFVNRSGLTMNEIYVSLSTDRNWGSDRLGQNVLPPGAALDIRLPAGGACTVDIRVVYADGRAVERRGVETCSIQELGFR